ncbi:MAG: methylated-DNA--[protein]-cysteine S-methyltransferase [Gammaproteobacteria bacterium]|nr:methylated-DNA--[protein]-cysteine S-methyltransferase [Gammaproteobacteria bacterium]MCF6229176.1 methylated-DNA--[protein]-cysteine S-methyltransferase [Gammaproteobacteria bacterium]
MTGCYQKLNSPLGSIHIATDGKFLRVLAIGNNWERLKTTLGKVVEERHPLLSQTEQQLNEYFSHQRSHFDLPLYFSGTAFQKLAWNALLTVPYGETRSYAQQAVLIGNPKAVRAIGRANGLNPISIIAPCHRIIGKSGKLTGYASGLGDKSYLINLERGFKASHPVTASPPQ